MLLARLVHHLGPRLLRQQRQRLRHGGVQRMGAETAANHQHAQRAAAAGIAFGGLGQRAQVGAHRVAQRLAARQHAGKTAEHAARQPGQPAVGRAGHRILFVHDQRRAAQRCHDAARESHIAAHAQHHVRPDIGQPAPGLRASARQQERQFQQRGGAAPAHALEAQGNQFDAARRHQPAFHLVGIAQPQHAPAALAQHFGHRQARHDVAARAARHDEDGRCAHTRPPRIMTRFSTSTRISIASAHRFMTMPEPP